MKMLVDENLPPALAKALAALFPRRHEIIHLRDRFQAGVTDLEWISLLGRVDKAQPAMDCGYLDEA